MTPQCKATVPTASMTPLDLPGPEGHKYEGKGRKRLKTESHSSHSSSSDKHEREDFFEPMNGIEALIQAVNDIEWKAKAQQLSLPVSPHPEIICGNILCQKVKQKNLAEEGWARRRLGEKYIWFCPDCITAYSKKQYCDYCKQIYQDTSQENAVVDGLDWIQCEECLRWSHITCFENSTKKDFQALAMDPGYVFNCEKCSKSASQGKKGKNKKRKIRYDPH